jgi:hypothetical protein
MKKGYIYLLECVSNYDVIYKIGFTKHENVNKRIKSLQTGNTDTIKCVYLFESKHNRLLETTIHNLYSYKRKGGEWFDLTLDEVTNFPKLCEKLENNFDILYKNDNNF